MRRRRASLLAIFPALIAVFVAIWLQRSATPVTAPPTSVSVPASEPAPSRAPEAAARTAQQIEVGEQDNGLDRVPENERAELARTLALIERGGPFPYDKDGSIFSNREGLLPRQPRGYYREYTVKTPGASNRGARRVVRGSNGELYYTRDHYDSFIRLDE
jgi:ribonuclease T1